MAIWADVAGIVPDAERAVEDARGSVSPANIGEGDAAPIAVRHGQQFADHLGASPADGGEADAHFIQLGKVGVGGELAVEDELGGQGSGAFAPDLGEAEDLAGLILLADPGVGVSEDARVGIAGEEGEDAALAAAALGHVVLLDQRLVAVVRDGVEVEVEGMAATDADVGVEAMNGGVPAIHQAGAEAGIDPGGVFRQRRALGHGIEAGEEGDALVEGFGADVRRPADAPRA